MTPRPNIEKVREALRQARFTPTYRRRGVRSAVSAYRELSGPHSEPDDLISPPESGLHGTDDKLRETSLRELHSS